MWQMIVVAIVLCISAVSGLAQGGTNFSGTWSLDTAKSKLDERARVESMTLTVSQTDKELKIETATKRLPPPADTPTGGMGRGGGLGRGGGFGGGDGTTVYNLDGKETTVEVEGPMGKMPVKYKASIDGGKANLSSSRTFSGQMGEVSITTKETWSLSADGKTLTVEREQNSPRGTTATTLVFVKK